MNAACILKACFKWVGYSKGNVIVCFSESYWVRTYELLTGNLNSDSGLGTISSLYLDLNSGCINGWAIYMKCPKRECHYMIAFVANIIKSQSACWIVWAIKCSIALEQVHLALNLRAIYIWTAWMYADCCELYDKLIRDLCSIDTKSMIVIIVLKQLIRCL